MDKITLYSKAVFEHLAENPKADTSAILLRLKSMLAEKKETALYPRILKKIISALEFQNTVTVSSKYPLDEATRTLVLHTLQKKFPEVTKEELHYEVDERGKGGVKISYRDYLLDGSIETTLRTLLGTQK